VPDVLNREVYDELHPVTDEEAKHWALQLASKEGIFVGLSCGGTLAAAMKVAAQAEAGSTILAMLPDTGERYLSTYLFEGMNEGSDDEWLASL
jgi:cysteine synthase A